MKTQLIFRTLMLMTMIVMWSCEDTDDSSTATPQDGFITAQIDEYPRTGDFIVNLESNLTGTITYSIVFESFPSAVTLGNGDLRVLDWLLFDFETIEEFLVEVEASNGSETEILKYLIRINDVDDIAAFLNGESRTAYDNASDGEWVMVEEGEYNDIANYLSQTTKSGTTDANLFSNANIFSLQSGVTYANDNGATIPVQHYLIGFRYYSWANNASNVYVKLSEGDVSSTYQDVGGILPDHNSGLNHFVLKGSNQRLSSTGYLAIYSSVNIGGKNKNDFGFKRENGNVDTINGDGNNGFVMYQGLSSSLKQWN